MKTCTEHNEYFTGCLQCQHDCIEELNELKNQWISVKDRLPEPLTEVIIYLKDKTVASAIYRADSELMDYAFFRGSIHYEIDYVTHWQPLPKPPEVT